MFLIHNAVCIDKHSYKYVLYKLLQLQEKKKKTTHLLKKWVWVLHFSFGFRHFKWLYMLFRLIAALFLFLFSRVSFRRHHDEEINVWGSETNSLSSVKCKRVAVMQRLESDEKQPGTVLLERYAFHWRKLYVTLIIILYNKFTWLNKKIIQRETSLAVEHPYFKVQSSCRLNCFFQ